MDSEEREPNLDTEELVEAAQPETPASPETEPPAQAIDGDAGAVEGAGDASEHEDMAHAVLGALGELARKFGTTIEQLTHLVSKQPITQTDEVTTVEPASDAVAADAPPELVVAMAETSEVTVVEDGADGAAEGGAEATAAPAIDYSPEPVMAMEDATDATARLDAASDVDTQPVVAQPSEPIEVEMPILAATEAIEAEPELPAEPDVADMTVDAAQPEPTIPDEPTIVEAASAADAAPIEAAAETEPVELDVPPTVEAEATSEMVTMATTPEATETLVELVDEIGPEATPAATEPAAMDAAEQTLAAVEMPAESADTEMVVVMAERPQTTSEE
jgi:hypothetical protein